MSIPIRKLHIDSASNPLVKHSNSIAVTGTITESGSMLILIADGGKSNNGCSVTNCIETIINYVVAEMGDIALDASWIQMDSDRYFDRVIPAFDENKICRSVEWKPLPGVNVYGPRTFQAFSNMYGGYAFQLFNAVHTALKLSNNEAGEV